jgi:AcrR family transcriptional regulator
VRPNQKRRTRKDLLQAAATLMKQGRRPSLDEVAEEALVSRATAYRYFPSIEALLAEASADMVTPEPAQLFAGGGPADPVARVEKVDTALHDMVLANESALRLMLANALQQGTRGERDAALPLRQNRRTPLIDAALEPVRKQFKPSGYDMLGKALALVIGTEGIVVCKDVLQLTDAEARKVKRWAIRALVEAAKK